MRRPPLPYFIPIGASPDAFPPAERATAEPNGLLAVGGDLSVERLLAAYRRGVFPWYGPGQPILWWCPDPRSVLYPESLRVSRSLAKVLRRGHLQVAVDRDFDAVIGACAEPRPGQDGTWITPEMTAAYRRLHHLGFAHSVEVREGNLLVGGLYGVALGAVFFGESMFSRVPDASKVALVALAGMGFRLIDCQVPSAHLTRMGAVEVSRSTFLGHLRDWCDGPPVDMVPR